MVKRSTHEFRGSARVGIVGGLADTARRHHRLFQQLAEEIPPEPDDWDGAAYGTWLEETEGKRTAAIDAAAITIIFAAAAAEGYIYDFAARALGDLFVEKNLDKLSTQSKWIIVPRLVANHEIKTDSRAYQLLILLTKARNEIVHPKTENMMILNKEQLLRRVEHAARLPKRADEAIAALDALGNEASKFDSFWAKSYFALPGRTQSVGTIAGQIVLGDHEQDGTGAS